MQRGHFTRPPIKNFKMMKTRLAPMEMMAKSTRSSDFVTIPEISRPRVAGILKHVRTTRMEVIRNLHNTTFDGRRCIILEERA